MQSKHTRVSELFARVLEKPAAERAGFLRELAGEDRSLREHREALVVAHEAEGVSTDALPAARATIKLEFPDPADGILGRCISYYKVLQKLGEGACGAVSRADQQEPVRRTVALKVIKLGMDTREIVARFEAERQALALMNHPNIAKVLDAGTTEMAVASLGTWNHVFSAATLTGHEDGISGAQFSPDGQRIVTASGDKTVQVWDAATGLVAVTLTGHENRVLWAQFSLDGLSIVTTSGDQTSKVWDAVTGKVVATLVGHEGKVWSAQFSPDGRRIVTTSDDTTARLWTVLPPSAGPGPEWFGDFLRYLGQMWLNREGELEMVTTADRPLCGSDFAWCWPIGLGRTRPTFRSFAGTWANRLAVLLFLSAWTLRS